MDSWRFLLKRASIYTALLIAIVCFVYISARFIPGDPITVLYGEVAEDPAVRRVLEQRLGLDKPLYIQLITYVRNIFTGSWGRSIYTGESVLSIVSRGYIASAKLALLSSLLAVAICILVLYIEFSYGLNSRVLNALASLLSSMPTAVWGSILLLFLIRFGPPIPLGDMAPPLTVLTLAGVGIFYRLFKTGIEYAYQQPFISTYTMMGFRKRDVFLKVLRFSLPIILSAALYRAGLIIAGAIVAETMFLYPGMGLVFSTALSSRDYPVLIGWGVAVSITLIGINLVIDIVHSIVDPRVEQ